jgi:hypothetical protein
MGRNTTMANDREEASYKEFLEAEIVKKDAEIASLKAQLAELKKQKGISNASEGLTFNKKTGLYLEPSTGVHFCPKGIAQDKRHPLAEENEWGWRCHICDHFYPNPDAEPPSMTVETTPF